MLNRTPLQLVGDFFQSILISLVPLGLTIGILEDSTKNGTVILTVVILEFIAIFIIVTQWQYKSEQKLKDYKPKNSTVVDNTYNNDLPQIDTIASEKNFTSSENFSNRESDFHLSIDVVFGYVIFYPLKLVWNLLLLGLTIWAFIAWWGLIFGSIVAIVLILIFGAYHILLLPLAILGFVAPLTPEEATDSEKTVIHLLGILVICILIYLFYSSIK